MASALILLEIEIESIERVFRDRLNPMEAYSDFDFIARYRITKYMFVDLLNKISTKLNRFNARSHSIALTTQLAVALLFLATGKFQTQSLFENVCM